MNLAPNHAAPPAQRRTYYAQLAQMLPQILPQMLHEDLIGSFEIAARDGAARTGTFTTAHGTFATPAFMPVGTQGTVKAMRPSDLLEVGAEIVLSNTYHLHLRPGDELIKDLGGLHRFMNWRGPILTDSGGYQVFSLARLRRVTDSGVEFQSHIDGRLVRLTPEKVVEIQENLGVDIMMVLDECLPYPSPEAETRRSIARTVDWAKRAQAARTRPDILCFGIVQGGMSLDLRAECAAALRALDFDGYAIGGLSVGEPPAMMYQVVEPVARMLPEDKIRYLMGVGTPVDIVRAVSYGIDLFDCVIPTRSARFGRLYVGNGYINIRNTKYRKDSSPLDECCDCYTCREFTRAYLSHLMHAREVLAVQLATLHNLRFYQRLMSRIRSAIANGTFAALSAEYAAAGPGDSCGDSGRQDSGDIVSCDIGREFANDLAKDGVESRLPCESS